MRLPAPEMAAAALALRGERECLRPAAPVLEALRRNKVPLLALEESPDHAVRAAFAALAGEPEGERAIRDERSRGEALLSSWREVGVVFAREGIGWTLFKSPRWFPSLSSNLDVLVSPAHFVRAREILEGLGHIRFPHYREDHKLLFRTFRDGLPALSVHLHEWISWGKVPILDGTGVVARAVDRDGLRLGAPGDVLIATIAHTVFETDQIRLSDLQIVGECLRGGAEPSELLAAGRRAGWAVAAAAGLRLYDAAMQAAGGAALFGEARAGACDETEALLREHPWARRRVGAILSKGIPGLPFHLPTAFSKEHLLRYLLADARRSPGERAAALASSAWSLVANRFRLRTRPGSLITVGGVDGSGKSAAVDALAGALELCEVPTARIWTRGGFSGPAVALKAAARRAAPRAVPGVRDEEGKRSMLRSPWRRSIWIWAAVLEQAVSIQRIRLHLLLGRTVIADRYVTDTLADLHARLPEAVGHSSLVRPASLLLGAAPAAALSFIIELSPEAAFERKPDGGSLDGRRRLAQGYRTLSDAIRARRIDGLRSREEVAQEIVDVSLRLVFGRFTIAGGAGGERAT